MFFHLKSLKKESKGYFVFKIDMKKVYDMVKLEFLYALMSKLVSCDLWVQRIIKFVEIVSYSVLLNGTSLQKFKPQRV